MDGEGDDDDDDDNDGGRHHTWAHELGCSKPLVPASSCKASPAHTYLPTHFTHVLVQAAQWQQASAKLRAQYASSSSSSSSSETKKGRSANAAFALSKWIIGGGGDNKKEEKQGGGGMAVGGQGRYI